MIDRSLTSLYKHRTDQELNHPASATRISLSRRDKVKSYVPLLSIIQGPHAPVIPCNPCAKVSGSAGSTEEGFRRIVLFSHKPATVAKPHLDSHPDSGAF